MIYTPFLHFAVADIDDVTAGSLYSKSPILAGGDVDDMSRQYAQSNEP